MKNKNIIVVILIALICVPVLSLRAVEDDTDLDLDTDVLSSKQSNYEVNTNIGGYQLFSNEYRRIIEKREVDQTSAEEQVFHSLFVTDSASKLNDAKSQSLFQAEVSYNTVNRVKNNSYGNVLVALLIIVVSIGSVFGSIQYFKYKRGK